MVLADDDPKAPVYRLVVKAPPTRPAQRTRLALRDAAPLMALPAMPPPPSPREVIAQRLQVSPDAGEQIGEAVKEMPAETSKTLSSDHRFHMTAR